MPNRIFLLSLMQMEARLFRVGHTGTGLALGTDLAGLQQRHSSQCRANQFIHQHAEQYHIAHQRTAGQGSGCHGHAQGYTSLGQQGDTEIFYDISVTLYKCCGSVCTEIFSESTNPP